LTPSDAYRIQQHVVASMLAKGARVVGHKVGLTSRAMQEMLGVDEPDFSVLLDSMQLDPGALVDLSELIQPRIEPEIAFVLGSPLRGPGVTVPAALSAVTAVAPALEVIDSRIADWRIRLADTIADLASSARFSVGTPIPIDTVGGDALPGLRGEIRRNGQLVGEGMGSAVLGHPAAALAWTANTLADHGIGIEAGAVVLSGSLCAAVPVAGDDRFEAIVERLGAVSLSFGTSPRED
jgi:2-keto-4-pentenoate hydratase